MDSLHEASPATSVKTEFLGFLLLGGLGFVIEFGSFNILVSGNIEPLLANLIAITLSASFNFVGNLRLTFKSRELRSGLRMIFRFLIVTVLTILASQALLWLTFMLFPGADISLIYVAKIVIIAILLVARFVAYRSYIYISQARL